MMHDDRRQPIAIGHLSDSGDLKILWCESLTWKMDMKKSVLLVICSHRIQEIDIKRYIDT